jgi:hypothetical protein
MNTLPLNSSDQIADPDLLEDTRRSRRRKALEYLAEADRLDALYAAVTGDDPEAAVQQEVLS